MECGAACVGQGSGFNLGPPAVHNEASLGLIPDSAVLLYYQVKSDLCWLIPSTMWDPLTNSEAHIIPSVAPTLGITSTLHRHYWHLLKDIEGDPNTKSTVILINQISSSSHFSCPS